MSDDKTVEAQSTLLALSADGTRTLTITTKTGNKVYAFSPEAWRQLSETAQWFQEYTEKENG